MKLGYAIMYVADVAQALAFWEQAFDLKRKFLSSHGEYGELETGATVLGFVSFDHVRKTLPPEIQVGAEKRSDSFEVALTTDDVAKALERAVAAGATRLLEPTQKPWGQTVAYVRDPNGHIVELCTPMS